MDESILMEHNALIELVFICFFFHLLGPFVSPFTLTNGLLVTVRSLTSRPRSLCDYACAKNVKWLLDQKTAQRLINFKCFLKPLNRR
jgi:hypothetical protein